MSATTCICMCDSQHDSAEISGVYNQYNILYKNIEAQHREDLRVIINYIGKLSLFSLSFFVVLYET